MDVAELLGWLTNGLDETEAAVVRKAVERDAVKANIATVKAAKEYADLQTQATAALEELDALDQQGNPKGYRAWYKKYGPDVVKQANDIKAFDDKHGAGSFAKLTAGEFQLPVAPGAVTPGAGMTEADVKKLIADNLKAGTPLSTDDIKKVVAEQFQQQFAPSTAATVVTAGHLLQKHFLAGRKNPIDFNALAKTANEKFAGDMDRAYDAWDQPERDKEAATAKAAEIAAAVQTAKTAWDDEALKKRSTEKFPGGADFTPGNMAHHKDADKYDKNTQLLDLAKGWNTAGDEKVN